LKPERIPHPKSAVESIATTSQKSNTHWRKMSKSYLDIALERRDAVKVEMDAVLEAVAAEERTDLTAEETEKVDALVEEARALDAKIEKFSTQATADAKAAEVRASVAAVVAPRVGGATVTREARTYTPEAEVSFVKDVYAAQIRGDYSAQERLARHTKEESVERRSVATDNFAGLVIPQYLVDLAAPYARAGRPTADYATSKHALPAAGMTLNISRMTTGTSTAVQETQNTDVSNTDSDDTLLTIPVRTIAGQQDLSKQAIERGTGIDTFVVADLIRSWHTTVDYQVLNGTGSNGQFKGIRASGGNTVTYTATTPTTALLYSKLADAYQKVESNVFIAPTHWIMHPRRLAAILASSDTTGRPLAVPNSNGPMNAAAAGAGLPGYGNSGYTILGLPVVTDANVLTNLGAATNQDEIYCVAAPEMHLWEQPGSPFALSFDATGAGSLTVKSVVYGFGAFSAERYPLAASIISGTGLVAPTF
jgi:HK97 family phage major capsid protein